MKNLFILLMFTLTFNAPFAAQAKELKISYPVYGYADETLRMQVIQTITPLNATKKIFLQNNKVLNWKDVNQSEVYCSFENARERDKTIVKPIKKDTFYKLTNDFFNSWEKVLGYRIWQKNYFFWDNGYYQAFDCNALNTPHIFTYGILKKHVGKYLRIGK
jgi:hypothetical protein